MTGSDYTILAQFWHNLLNVVRRVIRKRQWASGHVIAYTLHIRRQPMPRL